MMPRLLDLFCKQGGAGHGYHRAGFHVVGVDIDDQPRNPFCVFSGRDAVTFARNFGERYDAIHASPPCQAYSNTHKIQSNEHPDLIEELRSTLEDLGRPYVIENVLGAPLKNPIELCGAMFGLRTYRHRLFESNFDLSAPAHAGHAAKTVKMGRALKAGDFYHAVGNFSNVEYVRQDMGVEWMNRDGIRECVPPAYTEFIGRQLLEHLQ